MCTYYSVTGVECLDLATVAAAIRTQIKGKGNMDGTIFRAQLKLNFNLYSRVSDFVCATMKYKWLNMGKIKTNI